MVDVSDRWLLMVVVVGGGCWWSSFVGDDDSGLSVVDVSGDRLQISFGSYLQFFSSPSM